LQKSGTLGIPLKAGKNNGILNAGRLAEHGNAFLSEVGYSRGGSKGELGTTSSWGGCKEKAGLGWLNEEKLKLRWVGGLS